MPADPTPAPEWARKMADTCTGMTYDFIARLLASVRDAALREAAVEGATASTEGRSVSIAIHALIGTAPKQTEKEAPRG